MVVWLAWCACEGGVWIAIRLCELVSGTLSSTTERLSAAIISKEDWGSLADICAGGVERRYSIRAQRHPCCLQVKCPNLIIIAKSPKHRAETNMLYPTPLTNNLVMQHALIPNYFLCYLTCCSPCRCTTYALNCILITKHTAPYPIARRA
jgi:hypothetical protein